MNQSQLKWREDAQKGLNGMESAALVNCAISDISIKEELGYQSIQSIVGRYIQADVDWSSINGLGLIGIDEISLKKDIEIT